MAFDENQSSRSIGWGGGADIFLTDALITGRKRNDRQPAKCNPSPLRAFCELAILVNNGLRNAESTPNTSTQTLHNSVQPCRCSRLQQRPLRTYLTSLNIFSIQNQIESNNTDLSSAYRWLVHCHVRCRHLPLPDHLRLASVRWWTACGTLRMPGPPSGRSASPGSATSNVSLGIRTFWLTRTSKLLPAPVHTSAGVQAVYSRGLDGRVTVVWKITCCSVLVCQKI